MAGSEGLSSKRGAMGTQVLGESSLYSEVENGSSFQERDKETRPRDRGHQDDSEPWGGPVGKRDSVPLSSDTKILKRK